MTGRDKLSLGSAANVGGDDDVWTRRKLVVLMAATAASAAAIPSLAATSTATLSLTSDRGLLLLLANADRVRDISPGWIPIVAAALARMSAIDPEVEIRQIKQKLGGLRLYFRSQRYDELEPMVREAESLCSSACEECGRAARILNCDGDIRTLCREHRPVA
jgi:hypothetical protein